MYDGQFEVDVGFFQKCIHHGQLDVDLSRRFQLFRLLHDLKKMNQEYYIMFNSVFIGIIWMEVFI